MDPIPVGEQEVRGRDHRQLSGRRYQYARMALIRDLRHIHVFSVWVNDYHLMLVPEMIRKALPNAAIGFFLHVAFPSSEIFRCLSVREHLLRGLLASDLISFQTPNFARHFRLDVTSNVYS